MKRIAILASGSGTNAEAIAKHLANNSSLQVALIACNNAEAFVLQRAKNMEIPSFVFSKAELGSGVVLDKLLQASIDYIVLAGFLLKIPEQLISAYPNKIVNIHPSLLPKYGGKGMYGERVHQAVIDNNEQESGITIHFVNENFDEGEIITQAKCEVKADDTPDSLAARIHQLEHEHFPKTLEQIWA